MAGTLLLSACGNENVSKNENNTQQGTQKVSVTEKNQEGEKEEMNNDNMNTGKIEISELKIQNGENTIYGKIYRPSGEGKHPAIILSHGYNGVNSDFTNECTYYAKNGYIAYAYDFCGGSARSKSTGKSTDMTISSEKSDLLAVFDYIYSMDEVDKDNVVVFGGSQGGLVSTLVTEERADKVRALALYYPALCVPDDWKKKYPNLDEVPETFDFWGLMLGKGFVEDIHKLDVFATIGNYQGNVLILHGDKDEIVPYSYSEKAVALYPNAELVEMKGEGHGFSPAGGKIAMEKVLEFMKANYK